VRLARQLYQAALFYEDPRRLDRNCTSEAAGCGDRTTSQRLWDFVQELKQRLQKRRAARRSQDEIRARAREIWEQRGRSPDRDVEFWLQAEAELREPGERGAAIGRCRAVTLW
jgi:hypothetical protein